MLSQLKIKRYDMMKNFELISNCIIPLAVSFDNMKI